MKFYDELLASMKHEDLLVSLNERDLLVLVNSVDNSTFSSEYSSAKCLIRDAQKPSNNDALDDFRSEFSNLETAVH